MTTETKLTTAEARELERESLSSAWLASRLGVEPRRVNAMRTAGEIFGVPNESGRDHLFPLWQFGPDGRPLPIVGRLLASADEAGVDPIALYRYLNKRVGLTGHRRNLHLLLNGGAEHVVGAVATAANGNGRAV